MQQIQATDGAFAAVCEDCGADSSEDCVCRVVTPELPHRHHLGCSSASGCLVGEKGKLHAVVKVARFTILGRSSIGSDPPTLAKKKKTQVATWW